jgi:hypothetical protein
VKQDKKTYALWDEEIENETRRYAKRSIEAFEADVLASQTSGRLKEFLEKSGLGDVIIDTYQQRNNRRFTR